MAKQRIVKLSVWGLIAMIPGGVLIPSSAIALATHDRGVGDGYGRVMVGFIVLGVLCALIAMAIEVVAWGHAVANTRALITSRWFETLLWGGVVGLLTVPLLGIGVFVFAGALIAYLVGGPDGLAPEAASVPSRQTVHRWGNAAAVAGAGLVIALAIANMTNTGRPLHGVLWPSLVLVCAGLAAIAIGGLFLSVAYWAAIFNAHALPDPTWYRRLRTWGIVATATAPLVGLGAIVAATALAAYRRSGMDGSRPAPAGLSSVPRRSERLAS